MIPRTAARARTAAWARLRVLLEAGRWCSELQLIRAGGLRYGVRLLELRRGIDGGLPLELESERRPHGKLTMRWFRVAAATGCHVVSPPG